MLRAFAMRAQSREFRLYLGSLTDVYDDIGALGWRERNSPAIVPAVSYLNRITVRG